MAYLHSTLANNQKYWDGGYNQDGSKRSIFVAGKAGIPNQHMLILPAAITEVSDEELELLKRNHVFDLHVKNGFITIEGKKVEAEKVASSMNKSDKSKPKTKEEFEAEGKQAPKAK